MLVPRRDLVVAVALLGSLAMPLATAATVSVTPAISNDGNYTVSWTDTTTYGVNRLYLVESGSQSFRIRVGSASSMPLASMGVGTYYYKIMAYEYDFEFRREYFVYETPRVSVVVTDHRNYLIGVLASSTVCANGTPAIHILMDTHDGDSRSKTVGSTGITYADSHYNMHFYFCAVDGTWFKPLTTAGDSTREYAVLKLGPYCPSGAVEFGRFFDAEDSYPFHPNISTYSGNISPNYMDVAGNFMLRFCLFRYGPDIMQSFPSFGFQYAVFAGTNFYLSDYSPYGPYFTFGQIHTEEAQNSTPPYGTTSYFDIPADLDANAVYRIVDGFPHLLDDISTNILACLVGCAGRVGIHRSFNGSFHFYSSNFREALDYGLEATNYFYLGTNQLPGTVPFYRCNGNGSHFYTTSSTCENSGWYNEGVLGYIHLDAPAGTVPLVRMYNGRDHLYTISSAEVASAQAAGYYVEATAGYVWPTACN